MRTNGTKGSRGTNGSIRLARLGDVCRLNMGQSPDSQSYNSERRGLPFFQGNADFGERIPNPRLWCDAPKKVSEKGDLLISVRAPIGALNFSAETCCIGRGLAAITPSDSVDLHYLFYALRSRVDDLNARGTGSTFKAINKSELEKTQFPLPPLPEQKRIAEELDNICAAKKDAEAIVEKLKLLAKSRFVEMFKSSQENQNMTLADLSTRVKVAFVGTCAKYYTDVQSGVPMIRTTNITDHGLDLTDLKYVTPEFHSKNKKSQLHDGDILIARFGSNGLSCLYHGGEANCLNAIIIEPDRTKVEPVFLSALINSHFVQDQVARNLVGTTFAILNTKGLAKLKVGLPPLSLQQKFVAFIERLDKSVFEAQALIGKLDLLYRAKRQEYFG